LIVATILVIEDEDPICRILRVALEAAGHEVRQAPNGRIGLEMYRERPTDLVITDLFMPEMNGLDVVLELTREFLDTKVIAITGQGGEKEFSQVAKLLGARQILHKPLSMEKLLRAVSYELAH
jgi:DNA-binding response OmpR family regulator